MSGGPYQRIAVRYLAHGFSPVPIHAEDKTPILTGNTGREGVMATAELVAQWSRQCPNANVGLRLSGDLIGIDVDQYGDKHGAEHLAMLEQELGPLPVAPYSTSRGPGPAGIRIFHIPNDVEFPGKPCADVEFIQHHHRTVVAAPSVHKSGCVYAWHSDDPALLVDGLPHVESIPDLPAKWVEHFRKDRFRDDATDRRVQGSLNNATSKAVEAVLGKWYLNAPGGRHDAMIAAVQGLVRLEDCEHPGAGDALDRVRADFLQRVTTGGAIRTVDAAETEFEDALTGARSKIKSTPATRPAYSELTGGRGLRSVGGGPADNDQAQAETPAIPTTWSDAHVGEAFGLTLVGRWLYCRALGGWLRWDGSRWPHDPGEAVYEEFRQWIINLGEHLWHTKGDGDLMKLVARYREKGKIDAAVTIARRLTAIAATVDEFDQYPHLLNVENGVVDLRTGELGPHDPALRLTKIAGAAYRPDACHDDINAVLAALDTTALRNWVQRVFGSAAFGHVIDDTLIVFDGTGSNGKTTILKAVALALNEYAVPASTRLLMARGVSDEHPTLLADLFGRRLVYIEETPEGGALKMEQVKNITGGGTLKARFIGKDYFSFEPSHQLIVATNHRPAVNASDHAAWRRLRLVPFTRTYRLPHEARPGDLVADRTLRVRIAQRPQREAMLAWIVAGAVAWHRDGGLGPCVPVDEATAAWRRDEDVIHAWWLDRLELGGSTPAAHLYQSFHNWCTDAGRQYVSSNKEFVKKLTDHELYRDHGITKRSTGAGAFYFGLSVVDVVGTTPGSHERSLRETTPPPTTTTMSRGDGSSGSAPKRCDSCDEALDPDGHCWVHGEPIQMFADHQTSHT